MGFVLERRLQRLQALPGRLQTSWRDGRCALPKCKAKTKSIIGISKKKIDWRSVGSHADDQGPGGMYMYEYKSAVSFVRLTY